ncbi:hypothetical protein BW730_08440 [Tessaracoccus aquimaris]|uniref:Major facilitator superfamily (MFS) profile domain-containing protein n=1 Tax=Tessaracoccus aquimaris TaxID=1332264 RepID=A0A1Q2CN70_9ACTN|nr:MFS transporter [Tessaracoccus aquimaris]AQP47515.1 hypothetical protein BW730_08440 [Tessaracoccus aquimaris]
MSVEAGTELDPLHREPVSKVWLLLFALAWFGFWLLIMLPGQFLIVKLASVINPADKVAIGSFLIFEMAAIIVIGVPVIGWLCDRTRTRFGRRRTWALAGVIVATIPFAFVGHQSTWQGAALLLGVVALGESALLVSLSAVIADRVPEAQRGRASAAMGLPQVIALALGMVIVTMLVTDVGQSWMLLAVMALVSTLPFLFAYPDASPAAPERRPGAFRWRPSALHGYRDLGWAGLSRVLVNAGNLVGTTYLLYFLSDELKVADPDTSLLVLTLVYLVGCAVATWAGGVLTDRWRARKVLVAVCAGLQALAALILALVPSWSASIVAAVLLGVGYGAFLSVDQALLTDVLPDPETRARDLGVVNSAQHLPIAPVVGWAVLSIAGYSELYLVAAAIMALGGFAVFRIRSVR